jgi:hypothetical protein
MLCNKKLIVNDELISREDILSKNIRAINAFRGEMRTLYSWGPERIQRAVIVILIGCFILKIQPFRLNISKELPGDLTDLEKQELAAQIIDIYLTGSEAQLESIENNFKNEKGWRELV